MKIEVELKPPLLERPEAKRKAPKSGFFHRLVSRFYGALDDPRGVVGYWMTCQGGSIMGRIVRARGWWVWIEWEDGKTTCEFHG